MNKPPSEREKTLLKIIGRMLLAMDIQEQRQTGDTHISATGFRPIWNGAIAAGRAALAAQPSGEEVSE